MTFRNATITIAVTAVACGLAGSAHAQVYYKNCKEVRAAGKAPLMRGQPGYRKELDRDGDGIACEGKG